jgi:hypothetical protein
MRLLDYATNVYSQNGEDGILSKVLNELPETDKWCVEFGAWDGRYLSNTCHLIETKEYCAVLIEPDKKKFAGLLKNYSGNARVFAINDFVGFKPDDNLDCMLSRIPIPKDFDVLSIDIEGNDYHVWSAMSSYAPKVVHIAYNPMIPTEVDFVQPADPGVNQGASLLALTQLGRRKGYELVCANHNAAIFVRSKYFPLFDIPNNDPRILREDLSGVTYLFCGYDGTLFVTGRDLLGHHRGIRIQRRLRQLPRMFRSYPPNFSPFVDVLYKFYWRLARLLGRA